MRFSLAAVRNVAGLLLGLGLGLVLTSPAVSALSMVPGLSLLSPSDSSNVSGTVTFVAAADADGLVSLQFRVDGNNYGSPITSGSCRASFDTTGASDGPHTVQAVAQDEFGNTITSQPAVIFVNNLAPAISGVTATNLTTSSATIGWTTTAVADSQVEYGLTSSYGNLSPRNGTLVQNHAQALSGLSAGSTYHFRVHSVGQNGTLSSSGDFMFTTASAPTPTPTPTPWPWPTPTPGPSPTPTPTPTPWPWPTPTPTPTPTPWPTPTPTPGPSPTPTPMPTPWPTPTPAPAPAPPSRGGGATPGPDAVVVGVAIPRPATPTPTPTPPSQGTIRGASASAVLAGTTTVRSISLGAAAPTAPPAPSSLPAMSATIAASGARDSGQADANLTVTDARRQEKAPCPGADPFVNDGGGTCTNGTWVRADAAGTNARTVDAAPATAPSTPADVKTDKAPEKTAAATPSAPAIGAPAGKPASTARACTTPDPFAASGGVGLCIGGEWIALWKPSGRGGR